MSEQASTAETTTTATEIPIEVDDGSPPPDANAAKNAKPATPVTDAFAAGVKAEHLVLDEAPAPEAPRIDHAVEATQHLDGARGLCAQLAALEGDDADRLLEAADGTLVCLDAVLSKIDATKLDIARAIAASSARFANLPGLDDFTRKRLEDAARKQAVDDLMKTRAPELEALAAQAGHAAMVLEAQLAFETRFADHDLQAALDGRRAPEERASEDYLVSHFEGQSFAEIASAYGLLVDSSQKSETDRVRRFERAALRTIDAFLAKTDEEIAPGVTKQQTSENRERAERLKDQARRLRKTIESNRASRAPKSLAVAGQIVERVKSAWRVAVGFDARPSSGAVSDAAMGRVRGNAEALASARVPWKPMPNWHSRYLRAGAKK